MLRPPLVYLSTHKVKEGRLQDFERYFAETIRAIESEEPRLVAEEAWLDQDGTQVTIVHIFPDADAFELHMQLARERVGPAYEFLEPIRMEIFGSADDDSVEMIRRSGEPHGVRLAVQPRYLGGFTRHAVE